MGNKDWLVSALESVKVEVLDNWAKEAAAVVRKELLARLTKEEKYNNSSEENEYYVKGRNSMLGDIRLIIGGGE